MRQNQPPSRKPWQLYAIIAVTVIPIVAAYVAFYTGYGVPESTVNQGKLLSPAVDVAALFADQSDTEFNFGAENRQWRLLVPVTEVCDATCEENFYITRQVIIRLGEKAERVERYAVNLGGGQGQALLADMADDHPGMATVTVPHKAWRSAFAETNAPASVADEHYYVLVDQVGFAMMFYTDDNTGNELLKDLKRVLRYSPELEQ